MKCCLVMNTVQKLKLILKMSGLTQDRLAQRLDVTFAALNRWLNGKAVPRKNSLAKIDDLYREYTGQKEIPQGQLEAKIELILAKKSKYKNVVKEIVGRPDLYEQFQLLLTYNSNSIEGSTLTEQETAAVIFHNSALPDKSFVEQLEAKNHQTALQYIFKQFDKKSVSISEDLILKLHSILMNGIHDDAGFYRRHGVRIVGANVPTANYLKLTELMADLVKQINKKTGNIIGQVSRTHSDFEKIHPFSDGNGRVGRLIMTYMLLRANIPPAIISQKKKRFYYLYLNKAQTDNRLDLLTDYICDAILDSYQIIEK